MRSTSRGGAVGAPQTPGRSRYDDSEMFTTMTANDQDMVNRLRIQLMNERKMTEKYKKDLDLLTNREELENMRYQINELRKQLKEKDHELYLKDQRQQGARLQTGLRCRRKRTDLH